MAKRVKTLTTESNYLASEYKDLVAYLQGHPYITLASVEGKPPREYELIYGVYAYTPSADGIHVSKNHRIDITIPNGYPQAPPLVTAITPLYHPAIDEDDNCFSLDAWFAQHQSLVELVDYIGDLITGRIYDVDNLVNPNALRWYEDHKQSLPLDDPSHEISEETGGGDMLEGDFAPAFTVSEGISQGDAFQDEQDKYDEVIQEIRDLLAHNQIYTLVKRLADLPESLWFVDKEDIEARAHAAQEEAERLLNLARKLEDDGNYAKAFEYAQTVIDRIMPDHPGAQELALRLEQSSLITEALTSEEIEKRKQAAARKREKVQQEQKEREASREKEESTPRKKEKIPWLPEDFPLKRLLSAVLSAVIVFWLILLAVSDHATLKMMRKGLADGQNFMESGLYAEAKDRLERTREKTRKLTVLRPKGAFLKKKINALLNDPKLIEGAKGYVLYKGKYVPQKIGQALEELAHLEQDAQDYEKNKQYELAVRRYNTALERIESQNLNLPEERARYQSAVQKLRVDMLLERAGKADLEQKWEEASELYGQVESLLKKASANDPAFGADIQKRLAALQVRQKLGSAIAAMDKGRRDTAESYLQQAENMVASQARLLTEQDKIQVESARVIFKMYDILPVAKQAFETKQWEEAAKLYQKSLDLVEKNSRPEIQTSMQGFLVKVARTRDIALVNHKLQGTSAAARKRDWATVMRLEKEALALINQEKYSGDQEISEIRASLERSLELHRKDSDLLEKTRALEARGASIFRTNFANFHASGKPKATFLRREGPRLIFELSCMDSSGGRPTKLALLYAYNEKSGQWERVQK